MNAKVEFFYNMSKFYALILIESQ